MGKKFNQKSQLGGWPQLVFFREDSNLDILVQIFMIGLMQCRSVFWNVRTTLKNLTCLLCLCVGLCVAKRVWGVRG